MRFNSKKWAQKYAKNMTDQTGISHRVAKNSYKTWHEDKQTKEVYFVEHNCYTVHI